MSQYMPNTSQIKQLVAISLRAMEQTLGGPLSSLDQGSTLRNSLDNLNTEELLKELDRLPAHQIALISEKAYEVLNSLNNPSLNILNPSLSTLRNQFEGPSFRVWYPNPNEQYEIDVRIFTNKLKELARTRINSNMEQIGVIENRLESGMRVPRTLTSDWRLVLESIEKNKTLNARIKDLENQKTQLSFQASQVVSFNGGILGSRNDILAKLAPIYEKQANIDEMIRMIEMVKQEVYRLCPAITVLELDKLPENANRQMVLQQLKKGFSNARNAATEILRRINSDDLPLHKMPPLIEAACSILNITPTSRDHLSQNVKKWLQEKQNEENIIKWGSTAIGIAAMILCFTGVGGVVGLVIIGAIGAGAGIGEAVYSFEMAEDMWTAVQAQKGGSNKLIDDTRAIEEEYVWGLVNIAISAVDIFFSGSEMLKVGRLFSNFSTLKDGYTFINRFSKVDDAVSFLGKLQDVAGSVTFIKKLEGASEDAVKTVVKIINEAAPEKLANTVQILDKFSEVEKASNVINRYKTFDDMAVFINRIESIPNATKRNQFFEIWESLETAGNIPKGDYGEMMTDLYMWEKGITKLGGQEGLGMGKYIQAGRQGIDGIYETPQGIYVVADAKYWGSAQLADGQMTTRWIDSRLNAAIGDANYANRIRRSFKSVIARVRPDGSIDFIELDSMARQVGKISL
jgi:hypothetical protein